METEQKQRQQRQTHNAPGLNTSTAETIRAQEPHLLPPGAVAFLPETSVGASFARSPADLLISWDEIDVAPGLIPTLSHDVSGEIPKGQGDCGRI